MYEGAALDNSEVIPLAPSDTESSPGLFTFIIFLAIRVFTVIKFLTLS
jgi:hypothetical protein